MVTLIKARQLSFLSAEQQLALTATDGKFRISLYKALLFVKIAEAIKSGALNLIHSEKYRPFDEYLIPKKDWEENHAELPKTSQSRSIYRLQGHLKGS